MADGSGSASGPGRSYGNAAGSASAPRRPSYASVASGANTQTFVPSVRSGAYAHMAATTPHSSYPPPSNLSDVRHGRRQSESEQDSAVHGSYARDRRMDALPEYSRRHTGLTRPNGDAFFVPSYLKHCRYITKLEAAHDARSRGHRERSSSSTPVLVSGNIGSAGNTHRIIPSHRGMTYDVVESNPPKDEDEITPLPTKWNAQDKYPGLDITNDGLDVKYTGIASKNEHEAASVRADYPMSSACGLYYFEVEIKQKTKDCAVAVGFSTIKASLERLPGWESDSWAYHGDDGKAFSGEHQGRNYAQSYGAGDVIGCGMNFNTGQAFFTKNGVGLGTAFTSLRNIRPYPTVGIKKFSGATLSVNFGQRPFVYDIDEKVDREREAVRSQIQKTKTTFLHRGLDEHTLAQELVAQFLSHGGYVETARAFSHERRTEQEVLSTVATSTGSTSEADSTDAVHRQQIRRAILSGHIDEAFDITNKQFPTVLSSSPKIVFRLKCRKWVELISQASDLRARQTDGHERGTSRGGNGSSAIVEDVFDQPMELDDEQQQGPGSGGAGKAKASTSVNGDDSDMAYNQLLAQAMEYGQILQREYRDESGIEYKKTLADIFSLVAYNEPRESVHGHLLDTSGRVKVAEELNGAILVSLGRSPAAALEKTYRQTEALLDILSQDGGPASFVDLKADFAAV